MTAGDEHEGGHGHAVEERTEGGDPVCWLDRVCEECGAIREDMKAPRCARCGTAFASPGDALDGPPHGTG
ncbi:MAG: hypothetical protein HOY69_20740 [Streptomyces sp.]|nr:hypothetical protein [Streptomyces sp.]